MVVLTRNDLNRIRSSVSNNQVTKEENKRVRCYCRERWDINGCTEIVLTCAISEMSAKIERAGQLTSSCVSLHVMLGCVINV